MRRTTMREEQDLAARRCRPCRGDMPAMAAAEIARMLERVQGWRHGDGVISKTFRFANYGQTMAFANAVAWIAHCEDHHPQLTVGYNTCCVEYSTHAVNGISENDFICAAKVDALLSPGDRSGGSAQPVRDGQEKDQE